MRKHKFRNQPASVSGLLAEVKKKLAYATSARTGGLETTVVTNQLFGHDIDTDDDDNDLHKADKDAHDVHQSARQRKRPAALTIQRVFINFEFESNLFTNRLHSLSYLGKGGFALVFKAQYQLPTGESLSVAVKVLKPKHLNKASHYRRFLQEYAVHSVLKHRNIIEVKGSCVLPLSVVRAHTPPNLLDKHADYLIPASSSSSSSKQPPTKCWAIVQEYMEEGTLYSLVALQWQYRNSTIYTNEDALGWMVDVAEAMAYLHACDPMVVHRDLKLENILLKQGPQGTLIAKLGDFGLVVAVDKSGKKSPLPQLLHHPRDMLPAKVSRESSGLAKLMAEPVDKQLMEMDQQKMPRDKSVTRASNAHQSDTIRAHWSELAATPYTGSPGQGSAALTTPNKTPSPLEASTSARTLRDRHSNTDGTITSPRTPAQRSPSADARYLNPLITAAITPNGTGADHGTPAAGPTGRDHGHGVNRNATQKSPRSREREREKEKEDALKSPDKSRSKTEGSAATAAAKEAKNQAPRTESVKSHQPEVMVGPSRSWPGASDATPGGIDKHFDARQTVMGACRGMDPNTVRRMQPQQMASVEGMPRPFNATYRLTARCGSLLYMAPEVARDQAYNEKVDVFSFGVILYEVFGRDLVAASYVQQNNMEGYVKYAQKVAWMGFRPTVPDRLPHDLKVLIKSCWHKDPRKRPSFATIVRKLRAMQASGLMRRMDSEDVEGKVDLSDKWRTALTAPPDFFTPDRPISLDPPSERGASSRSSALRFLCGCFAGTS